MVNDQEPRYRLVDSDGNVVGSLFQNADGNVEIQDETGTGSVFGPDGIVTPAIDAGSVSTEILDSDIGGGRWNPLDIQEDREGDGLDIDFTDISGFDEYRLTYYETESGGTSDPLNLQINGADSSIYDNVWTDNTGLSSDTENSFELTEEVFTDRTKGRWEILTSGEQSDQTVIFGDGYGRNITDNILLRGNVDLHPVSSLQLFAGGDTGGVALIEGRDVL